MRGLFALAPVLLCACGSTLDSLGTSSNPELLPSTSNTFTEVLGVSDAEVAARIDGAYELLFHGDPATQAVLQQVGDGSAYILDVAEQDIGLDGMGYGLLISVQVGERADFDAIWQFTEQRMLIREGPTAGYYSRGCNTSFQCTTETSPDASEFLVTALILADQRWGSDSGHDYAGRARALLDTMLTKEEQNGGVVEGVTDMFDDSAKLVVLAPLGDAAELTQPSYVMPAFYELWARFQPERASTWLAMADAGRRFQREVAHDTTGLVPRVTTLDGTPGSGAEAYYDWEAARTSMHLALDHAWVGDSSWRRDQSSRLLDFFRSQGMDTYGNQYTLDGTPVSPIRSSSMVAMHGFAAQLVPAEDARDFVAQVWELSVPEGQWRYYDGMLYLLSLLGLSGNLRSTF